MGDKMLFKTMPKSKILPINDKISNYNDIYRESFQQMSKSKVESTSRSLKSSSL